MKILIAGDFCPKERVAKLFEKGEYALVLEEAKKVVSEVDYSIVNFECPIIKGVEKPISKIGPNLQCTEKGVVALKWAGFDCVTLANNHFYDYGDEGVACTLESCNKWGIDHVGGGMNIAEASQILYKDIEGQRLAVINCCEHEFSIATETMGGSNPINPIRQYYAIQEAKAKADYVLVIVHGGLEHWQLPSPRMVETYRFFIDAGADAVVNHHQHCYSGYEIYNGKPIFYGLGNFCFDNANHRSDFWNEGYMVELKTDDAVAFSIHPYRQCAEQSKVEMLPSDSFDARLGELNDIISDDRKLRRETEKFYSTKIRYGDILEPFRSRFYMACKKHGILPSLVTTSRKLQARIFMLCESHRDVMQYYLEH